MEIVRIIKAVEELIFELSSWLLCYPKSLAKALTRPGWAVEYVKGELSKDKSGAFDEYMSPALFYAFSVALVVLPHIEDVQRTYAHLLPESARHLLLASPEKFVLTAAILFGACPLGFAWVANAAARTKISRSALRVPLHAQFLIAAPFVVLLSVAIHASDLLGRWPMTAAAAWFCAAEWLFFQRFLGTDRFRSVLFVLAGFGAWYFVNVVWLVLLGLPFLPA